VKSVMGSSMSNVKKDSDEDSDFDPDDDLDEVSGSRSCEPVLWLTTLQGCPRTKRRHDSSPNQGHSVRVLLGQI
jgi:hypothetical protein